MDYRIEVITLAVRDVDLAVEFYTKRAGFILDVDYRPNAKQAKLLPQRQVLEREFSAGSERRTQRAQQSEYERTLLSLARTPLGPSSSLWDRILANDTV